MSKYLLYVVLCIHMGRSDAAQRIFTRSLPRFKIAAPLLATGFMHAIYKPMVYSQNIDNKTTASYIPELLPRPIKELMVNMKFDIGAPLGNAIILYGEPGTGKTECAKQLALDGGYEFVLVKSSGLVTKYQGSASEAITDIISHAESLYKQTGKRSLIFFDEIESICKHDANKTSIGSHHGSEAEVATTHLWQYLTQYQNDPRFLFCFATNELKSLHPTFINRFRKESIIEFKLPSENERETLLRHNLKKNNFSFEAALGLSAKDAEKLLKECVKKSDGMSHREIASSVQSFANYQHFNALSEGELAQLLATSSAMQEQLVLEVPDWKEKTSEERAAILREKISSKSKTRSKFSKADIFKIIEETKQQNHPEAKKSTWGIPDIDGDKWLHRTGTASSIIANGVQLSDWWKKRGSVAKTIEGATSGKLIGTGVASGTAGIASQIGAEEVITTVGSYTETVFEATSATTGAVVAGTKAAAASVGAKAIAVGAGAKAATIAVISHPATWAVVGTAAVSVVAWKMTHKAKPTEASPKQAVIEQDEAAHLKRV